MSKRQRGFWLAVLSVAALPLAPAAWAAGPVAELSAGAASVQWQPLVSYEGLVLTVSTPDGKVLRREFAAGKTPSLSVFDDKGQRLADGSYNWELRVVPHVDRELRGRLAAARRSGNDALIAELRAAGKLPEALVQSGSFTIQEGSLVTPGQTEEGESKPRSQRAAGTGGIRNTTAADQVIPDDLIVQGSTCVGFDCVNNESFGFDTIRMKENNTRIKFEDTSTGTYPTNDWQLTANDSASGGASKFSIEDITGVKVPFTITAGASTNSIFVDSTGRVGFRTSTPVLDLHVATSNTPAIRLEQNNSGGFTAQTWDIGANEANFFVRDVTGGSKLSLRIRPGAPTSSLDISADGDVGVGTASPDEKLHVEESVDANTIGLIQNTSTGLSANASWSTRNDSGAQTNQITHGSGRTATRFGVTLGSRGEILHTGGNGLLIGTLEADDIVMGTNNTSRLQINGSTGLVTVSNGLTVNGTFTNNSSRTFKEDFQPVDPSTVLQKFAQLPVQEWSYKDDQRKMRHVGPTVEDFQSAFGLGTDGKYIVPMDVQGITMLAVQGLYKEVQEKDAQIAELRKQLEEIKQLLESANKQQR